MRRHITRRDIVVVLVTIMSMYTLYLARVGWLALDHQGRSSSAFVDVVFGQGTVVFTHTESRASVRSVSQAPVTLTTDDYIADGKSTALPVAPKFFPPSSVPLPGPGPATATEVATAVATAPPPAPGRAQVPGSAAAPPTAAERRQRRHRLPSPPAVAASASAVPDSHGSPPPAFTIIAPFGDHRLKVCT